MEDKKIDDGQSEPVYGGCEGPNAMYVKLISSDDHEFIINRDYALTSGTIKAMLSGPGMGSNIINYYQYQLDHFIAFWSTNFSLVDCFLFEPLIYHACRAFPIGPGTHPIFKMIKELISVIKGQARG